MGWVAAGRLRGPPSRKPSSATWSDLATTRCRWRVGPSSRGGSVGNQALPESVRRACFWQASSPRTRATTTPARGIPEPLLFQPRLRFVDATFEAGSAKESKRCAKDTFLSSNLFNSRRHKHLLAIRQSCSGDHLLPFSCNCYKRRLWKGKNSEDRGQKEESDANTWYSDPWPVLCPLSSVRCLLSSVLYCIRMTRTSMTLVWVSPVWTRSPVAAKKE